MATGKMGCCARIQKCSIFLLNLVLFLFGVTEIGIALYIKLSKDDGGNFVSDIFEGNDTLIEMTLTFGVALTLLAFFGCCGAMLSNRCMLWSYVIILFFLIMGQAMIFAVGLASTDSHDEIFAQVWSDLSNDTILDIESAYDCCSFNGTDINNTWTSDVTNYEECSASKNDSTIETCWSKFSADLEENYNTIVFGTGVIFALQVIMYFSTHFVMQSIARAAKSELDQSDGHLGLQLYDRSKGESIRYEL